MVVCVLEMRFYTEYKTSGCADRPISSRPWKRQTAVGVVTVDVGVGPRIGDGVVL